MSLPYSDDAFVQVFALETAEAWCEGHVRAFDYFGGVPLSILYDNSKRIVAGFIPIPPEEWKPVHLGER